MPHRRPRRPALVASIAAVFAAVVTLLAVGTPAYAADTVKVDLQGLGGTATAGRGDFSVTATFTNTTDTALSGVRVAIVVNLPGAPEDFASRLHERLGTVAVVTLGARGALAWIGGEIVHAAPPPTVVVDSTGAGDAFCGSFAAALDRREPLHSALAAAVRAGAIACTWPGAQRVARPSNADPVQRLE